MLILGFPPKVSGEICLKLIRSPADAHIQPVYQILAGLEPRPRVLPGFVIPFCPAAFKTFFR